MGVCVYQISELPTIMIFFAFRYTNTLKNVMSVFFQTYARTHAHAHARTHTHTHYTHYILHTTYYILHTTYSSTQAQYQNTSLHTLKKQNMSCSGNLHRFTNKWKCALCAICRGSLNMLQFIWGEIMLSHFQMLTAMIYVCVYIYVCV